jgi:hypothetical protein
VIRETLLGLCFFQEGIQGAEDISGREHPNSLPRAVPLTLKDGAREFQETGIKNPRAHPGNFKIFNGFYLHFHHFYPTP